MTTLSERIELFDEPASWRANGARSLGFRGLDLAIAVAPGAGFPSVLTALAAHMDLSPQDVLVDVGAGLGGASTWMANLTGAKVIAVEPAPGSRRAAAEMFPDLVVEDGRADRLPVGSGSAGGVVAIGVCSLLDDLGGLLDETLRVLRHGGALGIADLFLVDGDTRRIGPNTFRSIPAAADELSARGFHVIDVGCGRPVPTAEWAAVQREVDDEMERLHGTERGFAEWRADQQHLAELVERGTVMSGCLVATTRVGGTIAAGTQGAMAK